jgi:single-strand DNA-binding protein
MGTKGENMNLNRVELIGFLGSEPETTYTPNGKAVANLSLATKDLMDERR